MEPSAKQLREELRALWPDIVFPWTPDREYLLINTDQIANVLVASAIVGIERRGEIWDCDEYSLSFNALIKRWCYDNNLEHQAAFGECFVTKLHGRDMNHSLNINRDEQGWWLINNDAKTYWKVNNEEDHIALVRL